MFEKMEFSKSSLLKAFNRKNSSNLPFKFSTVISFSTILQDNKDASVLETSCLVLLATFPHRGTLKCFLGRDHCIVPSEEVINVLFTNPTINQHSHHQPTIFLIGCCRLNLNPKLDIQFFYHPLCLNHQFLEGKYSYTYCNMQCFSSLILSSIFIDFHVIIGHSNKVCRDSMNVQWRGWRLLKFFNSVSTIMNTSFPLRNATPNSIVDLDFIFYNLIDV